MQHGGIPEKNAKTRDGDADLLRCIASFFVVMIHAASANTTAAIVFDALARFSVPVFVLISGYYLLPRRDSPRRCFRRAGRHFGLMLAWSFLTYLYELSAGLRAFRIRELACYLFTEPVHLWYLCAAAALALFTPALSVFFRAASRSEYRYALGLTFLLGSPVLILVRSGWAPTLAVFLERTKLPYLLGFLFLYLAGGYFARFGLPERQNRFAVYVAGLLGVGMTVSCTLLLSSVGEKNELLLSFFAPGVIAAGLAVFLLVKAGYTARYPTNASCPALRVLSDCTLGIYVLHPIMLDLFDRVTGLAPDSPYALLTVPLRTMVAFLLSFVIVFFLRRVPVFRRIV